MYGQPIHAMLTAQIRFSLTLTEISDPLDCLKALETYEEKAYKTENPIFLATNFTLKATSTCRKPEFCC